MVNKAAQKLGRMAAGKPKNFSAAELARRKKRLAEARKKRWPQHSARRLGRQEYRIGRRYSENPYSKMSEHYDQWAAGWSAERNGQ